MLYVTDFNTCKMQGTLIFFYLLRTEYFRICGCFMQHWTVLHCTLCNCDMNQAVKCSINKNVLLCCPFCIAVFSLRGSHYRNCAMALFCLLFSVLKLFILQKADKQKWESLDFLFFVFCFFRLGSPDGEFWVMAVS